MQASANSFLVLVLNVLSFFLSIFKNSQFLNLVVFEFFYFFVFLIIIAGFLFSFFADSASEFIVLITQLSPGASENAFRMFYWEGETLIKCYLLALFVFSMLQEVTLIILKRVFMKNPRAILMKRRRISFLIVMLICLVSESAISFFLKDWLIFWVGISLFGLLIVLYLWYHLVSKIVDKLKSALVKVQTAFIKPSIG